MKFEIRFEAKSGRSVKCWIRRTNIFDDAAGYDTFKGFDSLKIEVFFKGKRIDVYERRH